MRTATPQSPGLGRLARRPSVVLRMMQILAGRLGKRFRGAVARFLERALADQSFPPAVEAEYSVWSVVSSSYDQAPPPTERLIRLTLAAAERAPTLDLTALTGRLGDAAARADRWPGEHYRLLAALTDLLRPRVAVEIGTFTGMGTLAVRSHMPAGGRVITYDIIDWRRFPDTALRPEDFIEGIEQRLGDLSRAEYFERERALLRSAEMIFVDGPKDGRFEPLFLDMLLPAIDGSDALLVLDDIRVLNMVRLWRSLPLPKLDITSFGHWTGTGLAEAGPVG